MSSEWFGKGFVGPLADFAPGFAHHLARQGYATGSICHQMRFLRLLSRWLLDRGLGGADLHKDEIGRFLSNRRAAGHRKFCSIKAVRPALDYLRDLSVAPLPATDVACGPVDLLLERYRRYLLVERALAPSSVRLYVDGARPFLDRRRSPDGQNLDLAQLSTADVIVFVVEHCSLRGNRAAKHNVKFCALCFGSSMSKGSSKDRWLPPSRQFRIVTWPGCPRDWILNRSSAFLPHATPPHPLAVATSPF